MINVACVLKSGGPYDAEYVHRLYEGVSAHLDCFTWNCLSDVPEVATEPLKHNWPRWWPKLELFRRFHGEPTLYLDLDTVVVGDLSDITDSIGQMVMLTDFTRPNDLASGVMGWTGHHAHLYRRFAGQPQRWMNLYPRRGDGLFIADHVGECDRFQDLVPGQIVSYKQHCRDGVPEDARVVCFHGNPRPRDVDWHV